MPIRADYCDAWYDACQNDLFCSDDSGDFFACAVQYPAVRAEREGGWSVAYTFFPPSHRQPSPTS